jgi:hypothetical protein
MDALDFYTGTAIVVTLAIAWYVWRQLKRKLHVGGGLNRERQPTEAAY